MFGSFSMSSNVGAPVRFWPAFSPIFTTAFVIVVAAVNLSLSSSDASAFVNAEMTGSASVPRVERRERISSSGRSEPDVSPLRGFLPEESTIPSSSVRACQRQRRESELLSAGFEHRSPSARWAVQRRARCFSLPVKTQSSSFS